jgi:hypothetical protein
MKKQCVDLDDKNFLKELERWAMEKKRPDLENKKLLEEFLTLQSRCKQALEIIPTGELKVIEVNHPIPLLKKGRRGGVHRSEPT